MAGRIKEKQLKGVLVLILFIILTLQVLISNGQSYSETTYKGFVAGFGIRTATVSSNITEINQTDLLATGGHIGVIYGKRVLRSKINLIGYYSSAGSMPGTADLYISNASANFYPLSLLSARSRIVEPYVTAGISYDRFKFFGYYLEQAPGFTNYSRAEAPFAGKLNEINTTGGIGVELKLKDDLHFIHLFSEAIFARNVSTKKDIAFASTKLNNHVGVVVGVSFGPR